MTIVGVFNPDYNKQRADYEAACRKMAKDLASWIEKNPSAPFLVRWNYPDKTVICSTLKDAIDHGFVIPNEQALQMMQSAGWLDAGPRMPTALQARVVIESVVNQ